MEASKEKIKIIIGLGNPDKKYAATYHNVGYLFINCLKKNSTLYPLPFTLKSDTYMNQSGKFVAKALKKSGAKPENLLIAHDDSDIFLGEHKLSFGRGAAGHHGVESIIGALGTKDFWRLRIGIRPEQKEGAPRLKAEKFVLKKISVPNKKMLGNVFEKAIEAIQTLP